MITIREIAPVGVREWSFIVPVRLDAPSRRAPLYAVFALAATALALAAMLVG